VAKQSTKAVKFPIKGLERRWGFQGQGPFSTVDCVNVWPTDWTTGRERGCTRPALVPATDISGHSPLNWCEAAWSTSTTTAEGETFVGVAVASGAGVKVTPKPASTIGTPSSDCTVYLQELFATPLSGGEVNVVNLADGTNSAELVANHYEATTEPEVAAYDDGTVPTYCRLVQSWGDRLVLAGDTKNPMVIYMSRVGDARDWDYSAVDAGGAWANTGGEDGKIGEPITALIPHSKDCLLIGCTNSLYVLRGNPRIGGQKFQVSRTLGPLSQSAWCHGPKDETYIMTRDALGVIPPGCGEAPSPVSRIALPNALTSLGEDGWASLGYDVRFRGVHIYTSKGHYFFDQQSGGFWPMSFEEGDYAPDPLASPSGTTDDKAFTGNGAIRLAVPFPTMETGTKSGLMVVDVGGRTRQFDSDRPCEKAAHLFYGPFALGDPFTKGIMTQIAAALASGTTEVKWRVYTGESPEQAYADETPYEGTWNREGLNYNQHPMKGGTVAYIEVYNDAGKKWSIEEIMFIQRLAGRRTVG